ncbi:MAG: DNA polymerase II [Acidiferrobacterales bacterium]
MTENPGQVAETILPCFLLTRQWRDTRDGLELTFWAVSDQGPVRVVVTGEEAVCFIERETAIDAKGLSDIRCRRERLDLQALHGGPVDGLYFRLQRDLVDARDALKTRGLRLFESDIKPSDRYLMERFITSGFAVRGEALSCGTFLEYRNPALKRTEYRPHLRHVSLDIETGGLEGALYSIAVSSPDESRVFLVSEEAVPADDVSIQCCPDEKALLGAFFTWLTHADPDLILGWNVVSFDLDYLERKCEALGLPFDVARGDERATVLRPQSPGGTHVARIPGRVVMDGIDALRAAFWSFESFELEVVAQTLLGRGKRIQQKGADKVAEIKRLFREDKRRLAAYNLEDCRLVSDIFERAKLIEFTARRAELTGLAMDRYGGSVAAFDNLYLPRLHRHGRVAPDVDDVRSGPGSPGGYVMDSKPGLYDNVLLLDFKSLYPSIIRSFKIDPFGLVAPGRDPVPGFLGASFAKENAILPELIQSLWEARDEAKRQEDAALSQAIKILMNSFYGVLAADGCRFYDARLASSITKRGHEIIQRSREFIENEGYAVIYGDTDSLFVLLGDAVDEPEARAVGEYLAERLNAWWQKELREEYQLESFLEIEFETHFLRFLMPTVRGERTGSKKRYAGLVRNTDGDYDVVFKGLETVRTDWTPLARRFQRELYRRVFLKEPFEAFIRETLADLMAGKLDCELVYRKRLRRPLEEYKRNVPPHAQAARKRKRPGRWVSYVITAAGPEPVEDDLPKPDYGHYRDRQLAPVANSILSFLDTSFEAITDAQLAIF